MKKNKMEMFILIIALLGIFALTLSLEVKNVAAGNKAMSVSGFDNEINDPWAPMRNIWANQFTSWGYNTWNVFAPSKSQFAEHLSDNDCKFVHIYAHGGPSIFDLQDGVTVRASDVETWLQNKNKKTFVMMYHCNGMCSVGPGSFSYAYRKGSLDKTVTIGKCGAGGRSSGAWYLSFFDKLDTGATFKEAYDCANADFPYLASHMRFVGDESMTLTNCEDGCTGIDLTPVEIFMRESPHTISFKVENKGTEIAPECYHAIYMGCGDYWTYVGRKRSSAQEPGTIRTLHSSVWWPRSGGIKVKTNTITRFIDCNPENDELIYKQWPCE